MAKREKESRASQMAELLGDAGGFLGGLALKPQLIFSVISLA